MKIPHGLKKTAVLCVLKHQSKFLLLKRLKEPNKDMFTPVGGKLDPFETPLEAAIRETKEETGITVEEMKFCGMLTESAPTGYNWCSYVYLAEIDWLEPPYCNEGSLSWINFESVLDVPTPITDWHIYEYIMEGKVFAFSAKYDEALNLQTMVEEIENKKIH
ncbi:NUDIX domain-containing protein [Limibacter armeniacum]|uniref:NUDIX hydrolase n=1 Tax=Limibacter armeniacum TaxID=466084 RepID=UPI002FE597B1